MPLDFEIPPLLGKAESAGDARPNVRDVLVAHHEAIQELEAGGFSGSSARVSVQCDRGDRLSGNSEVAIREWIVSFDGLPSLLRCKLSAQFRGLGTLYVKLGGAFRNVSGSTVLQFSNIDSEDIQEETSESFDNPGGLQRIKLTGAGSFDICCTSIVFF